MSVKKKRCCFYKNLTECCGTAENGEVTKKSKNDYQLCLGKTAIKDRKHFNL